MTPSASTNSGRFCRIDKDGLVAMRKIYNQISVPQPLVYTYVTQPIFSCRSSEHRHKRIGNMQGFRGWSLGRANSVFISKQLNLNIVFGCLLLASQGLSNCI